MFEDLLTSKDDWFLKAGPSCEVVVSSRVRFARNIDGKKFPHHASALEQREVVDSVQGALAALPDLSGLRFVRLNEISSLDRQFLTEHQLISAEHAASLGQRAAAFDARKGVSFLVNEEDHLRLQYFRAGLCLKETYLELAQAEKSLAGRLPFSKDAKWGYLTACPTNLGGALRASVMLHLPALVYANRAAQVLQGVAQVGLAVRGLQGETTQIPSAFFQVSNQSSMGKGGWRPWTTWTVWPASWWRWRSPPRRPFSSRRGSSCRIGSAGPWEPSRARSCFPSGKPWTASRP